MQEVMDQQGEVQGGSLAGKFKGERTMIPRGPTDDARRHAMFPAKTTIKGLVMWLAVLVSAAAAGPLQVTVAPPGGGILTLSQTGSDQVTINATPSDGYFFSGWSGGTAGGDPPLSVGLTANFTAQQNDPALSGTLAVTPGFLAASGGVGGPFAPASFSYTVRNTGSSAIQWGANTDASWLSMSSNGGSLGPGAATTMYLTLTDSPARFGAGYYAGMVRFSNLTNSLGDTSRPASLVVTDAPGAVSIVTDGDSFSPVLTVDSGAKVVWNWGDGTVSTSAAPVKKFGSTGVRVNRLVVTPWSAVKRINLGYDADDGGDVTAERVPGQPVLAVAGLERVAPYLQRWYSSRTKIASLNFDNFVNLDTVECFQATSLNQVSLHNTPKLSRACFEGGNLGSLDLSESPALADLRGGFNSFAGVDFGSTGSKAWHVCIANSEQMNRNLPVAQFKQLKELFAWYGKQSGALKTASAMLTAVIVHHNAYTSADFSGGFISPNGRLDISDNQLTSLNVSGCPGLIYVGASNNRLSSEAVDRVLEDLDAAGGYTGTVDLTGNFPPGPNGLAHADSLKERKWEVKLTTQPPEENVSLRPPAQSIVFSTENDYVEMEVRVSRAAQVAWHWSDGSIENELTPVHNFNEAGHRTHYLTVSPPSALIFFGARYPNWHEGISAVSGLANYPNLTVLYLFKESITALDLNGCNALNELHLAANPVPVPVSDKWFADLDAMGGIGGTMYVPPETLTQTSARSRANLTQRGWLIVPYSD